MEVSGRMDRETPVTSTDVQLFCTPCKEEDRQEHAEGYCEVCQEYLCKTCISHHRKFRMTKGHKILQGADIPTKGFDETVLDTSCTEVCELHPGEYIKYYCESHDIVGCQPCTTINHRSCKLNFIPDLAKTYMESNEYKAILTSLHEIEVQLSTLTDKLKRQREETEISYTTAVEDIRLFRAELNRFLDETEKRLLTKAKRLKTENEKTLQNMEEKQDHLKKQFIEMDEQIKRHAHEVSKLFIITKRTKENIDEINKECSTMLTTPGVVQYYFKRSQTIESVMSNDSFLGEMKHKKNFSILNIDLKNKISMVHSSDKYLNEEWITGLCLLSPDTLLTVDYNNKALKLLDISSQKITSTLGLTSGPWDVTCLPDDQVAVTMLNEKKIQIASTRGGLSRVREITVSGQCRGIFYSDSKLLVTYCFPGKLEIMGLDGTVSKTVTTDIKGNNVFTNPYYITLLNTCTGKHIYMSDCSTNTVIKYTMEGEIVSQFQNHRLSDPCGLVAIGHNHLAVCSYIGHKITVIMDEDGKMEIVKQWDCVQFPRAIEFSPKDNTLYVSGEGGDDKKYVHVYKLSE